MRARARRVRCTIGFRYVRISIQVTLGARGIAHPGGRGVANDDDPAAAVSAGMTSVLERTSRPSSSTTSTTAISPGLSCAISSSVSAATPSSHTASTFFYSIIYPTGRSAAPSTAVSLGCIGDRKHFCISTGAAVVVSISTILAGTRCAASAATGIAAFVC